jgi:hypothetical protein
VIESIQIGHRPYLRDRDSVVFEIAVEIILLGIDYYPKTLSWKRSDPCR